MKSRRTSTNCADALEIDWADVLSPGECSYVFGNPPFGGAKFQSPEQRAQVRRVAALGGSGGTLDYVAAWFIRAGDYVRRAQTPEGSRPPRIGFVATNSITQGEQVAQLWPLLLDHRRLEIAFAHRTFAWGSDARGKAHVHVVIIGLAATDHVPRDRRLFAYEDINREPLGWGRRYDPRHHYRERYYDHARDTPQHPCVSEGAVSNAASNPGLVSDCAALLEARDTLAGTASLNWSASTPIADWDGVTLGAAPQRVIQLRLQNKGLNGTIPASLGRLSKLEALFLTSGPHRCPVQPRGHVRQRDDHDDNTSF